MKEYETKTDIDIDKLGEQFGTIYRKLRPKVEEAITKPEMQPLYEKMENSLKHEFGGSLSKKDMLDLLTFYLVIDPVHQAIYNAIGQAGGSVD